MRDESVIEVEVVENRSNPQENRIVQVTPELEIERLRTRRAELATERTKSRWQVFGSIMIASTFFASCAQTCNPW